MSAQHTPGSQLQGGMTNDELREAWGSKLPGVEPKDRELTAFALGIELGDVERRNYFDERNSARDAWRMRVKQCDQLTGQLAELIEVARLVASFSFNSEVPLGDIQARARAAISKATGEAS